MIKHTKKTRGAVTGSALAVGILAVAGTTWASTPDGSGVIHSCYNISGNPSGSLRVIDTSGGGTCAKNEKALNFNQTGPQGPAGPQGVQGPQGFVGAAGADGKDGSDGQAGATGPAGPAGPGGATGAVGAVGATGPAGTSALYTAGGSSSGGYAISSVVLNVPPGHYAVSAVADAFNNDNDGPQDFVCSLNDGNNFGGRADRLDDTSIPLLGNYYFSGAGTLTLTCIGYKIVMLDHSMIQAIKIG